MKKKTLLFACIVGFAAFANFKAVAQNDAEEWNKLCEKLALVKATWVSPPAGIVTTKLTTGMLLGNGDIGIVAGDTLDRQTFYFGKSDFWGAAVKNPKEEQPVWQESVLSLGGLTLSCPDRNVNAGAKFRMEQDIQKAEVRTNIQFGNAVVKMVSWTADADGSTQNNYFITELTTDGAIQIQAELWVPSTYKINGEQKDCSAIYPFSSGVTGKILWTTRENYNNNQSDHSGDYKVREATALSLSGSAFTGTSQEPGRVTGTFLLKPGKKVYLVVAFETAKAIGSTPIADNRSLVKKVTNAAEGLRPASIVRLSEGHRNWWKNYWMKSWVNLNDPVLDKFYYGSLYMLGSTVRAGNFPPSLFGNWITTDLSSWGGRFFLNYNEQAALYGVASSNRPELILPYSDLILKEMPWQRNRTHAAGYDGVCHQRSLTPYHLISEVPDMVPVAKEKNYKMLPTDQKSNGVFTVLPLIWYYEYTQDRDYLKNKLYPHLKELDAFYQSYVNKDRKPYIIEHSSAHEGSDDINPNLDLGFIRRLDRTLINACKALDTDREMVPVWQDMLDNLSDYPTMIREGKKVYVESQTKNGTTDKIFHEGCQPVNLEGGVYPGENIYIGGNPGQLEIARESLKQLGGWCVNQGGSEHNGFPKQWPVAARIGWPAEDLYSKLKEAIVFHWREANMTVFQGGGGIETAGAMEGINSMLMQSEGGKIRLFPVWPADKPASFQRLRAKGAFLVSSEIRFGRIKSVRLYSEQGGPCTVVKPWPGNKIRLIRDGKESGLFTPESKPGMEEILTFQTKKGETIELKEDL